MKITRDNYEIYFIDYLEGNLDEDLVDGFIEFLKENPDLKDELQQVGSFTLTPDSAFFNDKKRLYKGKYDQNKEFDKAAVAYMEGDLTVEESAEFKAYLLGHPEKQQELAIFEKTKLIPDDHIVFHSKKRLYRSSGGKTILLWVTRVAAVVAIAILAYRYAGNEPVNQMLNDNQVTISENKNEDLGAKRLPEIVEKEKEPVAIKENPSFGENKPQSGKPVHKSSNETSIDRTDQEKIANVRPLQPIPEKIPGLNASLSHNNRVIASLVPVESADDVPPAPEVQERLLVDVVKEKTGLDNLSLNKVAKAGLNLVNGFSRDKFNYETNAEGQITELNYDSRLLAFSIPTKQKQ